MVEANTFDQFINKFEWSLMTLVAASLSEALLSYRVTGVAWAAEPFLRLFISLCTASVILLARSGSIVVERFPNTFSSYLHMVNWSSSAFLSTVSFLTFAWS